MGLDRGKRLRMLDRDQYRKLLSDQVLRNSVQDGECRVWTGSHQENGYGSTRVLGRVTPAHRAAYIAFVGDIEDGKEVCHKCDVRNCVNPDHLYIATHAENMKDMQQKHRGRNGVMSGKYKPVRNERGQFLPIGEQQ